MSARKASSVEAAEAVAVPAEGGQPKAGGDDGGTGELAQARSEHCGLLIRCRFVPGVSRCDIRVRQRPWWILQGFLTSTLSHGRTTTGAVDRGSGPAHRRTAAPLPWSTSRRDHPHRYRRRFGPRAYQG